MAARKPIPAPLDGMPFSIRDARLRLDGLVALGDHLVGDPRQVDPGDLRPYATLAQLAASLHDFSGRGARAAASALKLIRVGAESPPELQGGRSSIGRAGGWGSLTCYTAR
ncbi:hypothetical protein EYE40_11945 [Glaciihabitans arcticus]|uniref:Uncharacterized protein n=1 Tax=Glaciihabitans arcticus TaxID=2668039 RepID=A0A4Q9GXS0_9MICO|nr:hypothetical protein [Glaciihabitans arcticus]TBN58047.1 hypothetical protein EYE40_11945 [Glaciihabitans arcticus]